MVNLRHAESVVIARPADALYDMISDVTRMGEWSPICTACWWDEGAGPWAGSWFTAQRDARTDLGDPVPGRDRRTRPGVRVPRGRRAGAVGLLVRPGHRGDRGHGVVGVPPRGHRPVPRAVRGRRRGPDRAAEPGRAPGHPRHPGRDQEERRGILSHPGRLAGGRDGVVSG